MKKTRRFELRLSENDYKIIARKAEILNISMGEYLRQAGINKQVKGYKKSDLDETVIRCKGQLTLKDLFN